MSREVFVEWNQISKRGSSIVWILLLQLHSLTEIQKLFHLQAWSMRMVSLSLAPFHGGTLCSNQVLSETDSKIRTRGKSKWGNQQTKQSQRKIVFFNKLKQMDLGTEISQCQVCGLLLFMCQKKQQPLEGFLLSASAWAFCSCTASLSFLLHR